MNDLYASTQAATVGGDEPFIRYTRELAWLDAEPDSLSPLVREAAAQRGWTAAATDWIRSYGSFSPQRDPFCVFVYETVAPTRDICLAELFASRPVASGEREGAVIETPAGWIRLSPLGYDPRLGTLTAVLARFPAAEVIRYRPYRRCTLRTPSSGTATRFIKVFADEQGASVHENTVAVWQARQRGELSFNVACPLGWEVQSRSLSLGLVPGEPILRELLSARGPALSARMGRACAEIAVSGIKPISVFDAAAQMRRSGKYAEQVKSALPHLSERIEALLSRLAAVHRSTGGRQ
ncbi:MAG: hypothetical protein OEM00_01360, partial [Burkholderiaceae bacterium]|nr:hypothetical protein [Burkholderiaceae bacterium]